MNLFLFFSSSYITATAFKVKTFPGSVSTSDMLLARVHGFKIAAANFHVGVFQEIVLPFCFVLLIKMIYLFSDGERRETLMGLKNTG